MEKSSFFNSKDGDRRYKAEDWAEYFASFISNGIMPLPSSGLQVVAGENMTVKLRWGKAWINGYFYHNTDDLFLQLMVADGVLNRIDRIVIRWNLAERTISAKVKTGTPASSPTAPAIQRNADIYELAVADIYVGKGVTAITQAYITDQRLNGELCGVSAGIIKQIDTTEFNAQLQAWFKEYMELSDREYRALVDYFQRHKTNSDTEYQKFLEYLGLHKSNSDVEYRGFLDYLNAFKAESAKEFNEWFETVKGTLGEDAAGNLFNLITALTARVDLIENVLFNDITDNPFLIAFDNLDGIITNGIWNKNLQRIEC